MFRRPRDDASRPVSWQKMRKEVSDLPQNPQIHPQGNERYADTLAAARVQEKLQGVAAPACNGERFFEPRPLSLALSGTRIKIRFPTNKI